MDNLKKDLKETQDVVLNTLASTLALQAALTEIFATLSAEQKSHSLSKIREQLQKSKSVKYFDEPNARAPAEIEKIHAAFQTLLDALTAHQ